MKLLFTIVVLIIKGGAIATHPPPPPPQLDQPLNSFKLMILQCLAGLMTPMLERKRSLHTLCWLAM